MERAKAGMAQRWRQAAIQYTQNKREAMIDSETEKKDVEIKKKYESDDLHVGYLCTKKLDAFPSHVWILSLNNSLLFF